MSLHVLARLINLFLGEEHVKEVRSLIQYKKFWCAMGSVPSC